MKTLVRITTLLVFVIITVFNVNACNINVNGIFYYESIEDVIGDITHNTFGRRSISESSKAVIEVSRDGKNTTIKLLENIETGNNIEFKDLTLDLNGYSINVDNDDGLLIGGQTTILGETPGSKIFSERDGATLIAIRRGATCKIIGGNLNINAKNERLCAIHVYGNLEMYNVSIIVNGNPTTNDSPSVYGVYGNLFSKVKIESSNIEAYTQNGSAYAVFNSDKATILNSTLIAYSNYLSDEKGFIRCSIGCYSDGILELTNCNISGIHSGVNSRGKLTVNGGTYSGFGHGGIYFSGCGQTSYVKNATLQEIDMPDGYVTQGPISTNAGCYIGGGEKNDNLTVYMDNCSIFASKHSIVLRGSSGEQNNKLYVSNTNIDVKSIRIDNDTHSLFVGTRCNFDATNTTIPEVVVQTEEEYI